MSSTNLPPPPPKPEGPTWERWLNLLRKRTIESLLGSTFTAANGFEGTTTVVEGQAQTTLSVTASGMVKGQGGALVAATPGADYAPAMRYGSFWFLGAQSAAANTATTVVFDATQFANSISLGAPASRVVVGVAGVFNVQFSLQFKNPGVADDNVTVWLRKNGSDLANSAGAHTVPGKHVAVDGAALVAWNVFEQCSVNDYFELCWATDTGGSSIVTYAAGAAPVHPVSPGVILTLTHAGV